ncbi:MAG TPA: 3-phosphoshikimate 1-carboxyvinyltransferase, partial [bacterium]|nr:3-phosphoshikimate 1-carboxyvinyltransferase [bacterium]
MHLTTSPTGRLAGRIRVSGDKSISHRAVIIGALARGDTVIYNFLHADDCLRTVGCLRALGVEVDDRSDRVIVHGRGPQWRAPSAVLDAGNSGTTMRLLTGILAAQPFASEITGDASLRLRPMDRVIAPLAQMGARIVAEGSGRFPPLHISGGPLRGITYMLPVASAQVKSAVLLAGLLAEGTTSVVELTQSRDHTERMLEWFGAKITRESLVVHLTPGPLAARTVVVPGDISSAAFFLAAAAALPGSELTVEDLGLNPTRTGVLDVLQAMGADIVIERTAEAGGEPVGRVTVRGGPLRGIRIGGALIPRLIDELPILCVAATAGRGTTIISDAAELRVKESDRIGSLTQGLRALGGEV